MDQIDATGTGALGGLDSLAGEDGVAELGLHLTGQGHARRGSSDRSGGAANRKEDEHGTPTGHGCVDGLAGAQLGDVALQQPAQGGDHFVETGIGDRRVEGATNLELSGKTPSRQRS